MPNTPQPPHAQFAEKRDAINSIVGYLEKAGVVGYAIEIPQSLVETNLQAIAVAVRDLGRFAVVLPYHADLNEYPGERDDIGGPDLPPTPHPLRAIDAAVSYEAALRQWTRCYAVVMPVMALDTEPGHAFRRTCISLDVQIAKAGPALFTELQRLTSQVGGYTWPTAKQVEEEGFAITGAWKHVPNRPIR